jgi:hypothetical protein
MFTHRRWNCSLVSAMAMIALPVLSIAGDNSAVGQIGQPTVLTLPAESVQGISQPLDATKTEVLATAGGKSISLPILADVNLIHGGTTPLGGGNSLQLRDACWSTALFRIDPAALAGASDFQAALQFKVHGVEKPGLAATFGLYRVLTDWSSEATWTKPSNDNDTVWNGLHPGTDFEAKPFAELHVDALQKNQEITIDGLADALTAWRDGKWPNNGFLLVMNGKALQCDIPSHEAGSNVGAMLLGGPTGGKILVKPNDALLDHVLLKPSKLAGASLVLTIAKAPKLTGPVTVQVMRALKPIDGNAVQPGVDFDPTPIASASVPEKLDKGDTITIDGLGDVLNQNASADKPDNGYLVMATSSSGDVPAISISGVLSHEGPAFAVTLPAYEHASLFQNDLKNQPNVYCVLKDGHLTYGGQRLRLWGVVGFPVADRLIKMGFNAQRVWEPRVSGNKTKNGLYTEESEKRGEPQPYTKGDGSFTDTADKYFADLKSRGMFVMFGTLGIMMPVPPLADDDSFIAPAHDSSFDASDWKDWKQAVTAKGFNGNQMAYLDDRLKAIKERSAKNLLTHVNPYTGKAYGQDEAIAIYEMGNEVGFPRAVIEGLTTNWPAYFRSELQRKWNAWLKEKYANDGALTAAWGKLNPGESLGDGSVKAAPDLTNRVQYPKARGEDFVHFVIDTTDHWNQRFRSYCRTLAPTGVGVNVVPFSFDTRYRPNLQWDFTDSRGEANSFGMYYWYLDSALTKPPASYLIDSGTVQGSATVMYETNIGRPDKYRAEYPFRLAALASWQDWDAIFWHYWGPVDGQSDEVYLTTPLQYERVEHYWAAVIQENDPVLCSAFALAGRIFLNHDLHTAPNPITFDVGSKALYSFDYANGLDLARPTFSGGATMNIDPSKPSGVSANGGPLPEGPRLTGAVAMGDQVIWDWPNGRMIIDTPMAKAYVGKFTGPYKFKDGIEVGDVNTPFVAFGMVSADGKPLVGANGSKRVYVTAVFDARNTGFQFNWNVQGGPIEMAKAVSNRGHPPVIQDAVNYTIWFPTALDGHFDGYDFAARKCESQTIASTNRIAHAGQSLFMGVISIDHRGAGATVPAIAAPEIAAVVKPAEPSDKSATTQEAGGSLASSDSTLWNPFPNLSWNLNYDNSHRFLRESTVIFSSISPEDLTNHPQKTITLSDAQLPDLWNAPADVQFNFDSDHLQSITATLKQPPPFEQAAADFAKRFGPANQKQLGTQYERSLAQWNDAGNGLSVTLTESQGTMQVLLTKKGAS